MDPIPFNGMRFIQLGNNTFLTSLLCKEPLTQFFRGKNKELDFHRPQLSTPQKRNEVYSCFPQIIACFFFTKHFKTQIKHSIEMI